MKPFEYYVCVRETEGVNGLQANPLRIKSHLNGHVYRCACVYACISAHILESSVGLCSETSVCSVFRSWPNPPFAETGFFVVRARVLHLLYTHARSGGARSSSPSTEEREDTGLDSCK